MLSACFSILQYFFQLLGPSRLRSPSMSSIQRLFTFGSAYFSFTYWNICHDLLCIIFFYFSFYITQPSNSTYVFIFFYYVNITISFIYFIVIQHSPCSIFIYSIQILYSSKYFPFESFQCIYIILRECPCFCAPQITTSKISVIYNLHLVFLVSQNFLVS